MGRLCERPGCSDPASVAYGMRTEDLVFWLAAVAGDDAPPRNLLCGRHADSMIVPRGWTLDDQRDPDLHLFRPPEPVSIDEVRTARRPRRSHRRSEVEQLVLGPATSPAGVDEVAEPVTAIDPVDPADPAATEPWMPQFDHSDDLDGLLSARSPLLARAFRGDERPR